MNCLQVCECKITALCRKNIQISFVLFVKNQTNLHFVKRKFILAFHLLSHCTQNLSFRYKVKDVKEKFPPHSTSQAFPSFRYLSTRHHEISVWRLQPSAMSFICILVYCYLAELQKVPHLFAIYDTIKTVNQFVIFPNNS